VIETGIQFTPEQKAAIMYRDGSLLVSAAAGSGKTKVLVERLLSRIDEGDDIDEFLVITYTRAAAFELRERIHEELLSRLSDSPGNLRLRRQSFLCRGASIDTIHTFCSDILRENAHIVRLPPDFRVIDESESTMIMNEVAESVLNDIYENTDDLPGFRLLVDTVADGRDDKMLINVLLDIFRKIQSIAYPNDWIKDKIDKLKLDGITDISETEYGKYLVNRLRNTVSFCRNELENLMTEMEKYTSFKEKYAESTRTIFLQTSALLSSFDVGWDEARRYSSIEFPRPKPIRGHEELKDTRTRCIRELKKCIAELEMSSAEHIRDMKQINPAITALLELLLRFDAAYMEEKRRRSVADFSDLEHLTLSLLIDKATGQKTDLAISLTNRFKEIMIDEYQDVNEVQEYIFNAIAHKNENVFMVGDVKQSIYRFRLADPSIFLSKYNRYREYSEESRNDPSKPADGVKIHLSKNFRSKAGILGAVNQIFSNIMSVGFGELDYSEKEWLVPGKNTEEGKQGKEGMPYQITQAEKNAACVEIDILDLNTYEDVYRDENITNMQIEADHIAAKIENLIDSNFLIQDNNDEYRQIKYSDITILLRSMKGRAWQYAASLSARGIPSEFPGSEGFFKTLEVTAILSLLKVIDNPLQDIPLAAVLTGPIYRFSSDELTEVYTECKGESLYDALIRSAEQQTRSYETHVKCKKITTDIKDLRVIAPDMTSDRFIWHVYNKTGLLGLVGSFQNGDKRRSNLIFLAEAAQKFESSGYKGLYGFLGYISSLQDRGYDLSEGSDNRNLGAESANSVKIMSIHKSKGLEFPVVIIANTAKAYNLQDSRKSVVFHSKLGLGTMLIDNKRRVKYTTIARSAIQRKLNDEMLSEEARVLYVAMTRAKEKLIITATLKDAARTFEKIQALPSGKIDPQLMMSMGNMAEWILAGIHDENNPDVLVNTIVTGSSTATQSIQSDTSELIMPKTTLQKPDFTFEYPYASSINLPSKITVTDITKQIDIDPDSSVWLREPGEFQKSEVKPLFLQNKQKMTASERGILLHLVMQHLDYDILSAEPEKKDVDKQLQILESSGVITREQSTEINKNKICKFLNSAIGGRLINAKKVYKEFKFSILRPAEEFFAGGGSDEILVQGIIDCFFEEDNEIVIIDFKTDKITLGNIKEKAQRYAPQLGAYADAVKRITGKQVKERIIYFFAVDSAYSI